MTSMGFSQRDPRWAADKLGTSELTLGQAGCLVTAAAALLASWGVKTDPHALNAYLREGVGFVDDNLFVFSSLAGFGATCTEFIDCARVLAPVARLAEAITNGAGCLAMVDFTPGGTLQSHWVWITALSEKDGRIMDPWQAPGQEMLQLSRYLAPGWTPARGIFLAALYSRGATRSMPSLRRRHQPAVCLLQMEETE